MFFVFVQRDRLGQIVNAAVDSGADIASAARVLKYLRVLALSAADHRSKDLEARTLGQGSHLIDDLVYGLLADLLAALRTMGSAHAGPEKTHVVVDLRHRADGGAGFRLVVFWSMEMAGESPSI